MPELGKATYTLVLNSTQFDAGMARAEARAAAATNAIASNVGKADAAVSSMGPTAGRTAVQVGAAGEQMAFAFKGVGTAAVAAGEEAAVGAAAISDAAGRAAASVEASSARQVSAWTRVGRHVRGIGRSMTRAITLPTAVIAGVGVKMALDYQEKIQLLESQAGATSEEMERMGEEILALAKVSTQGPQELADAMFHIESTGIRGAKALELLRAASEGAMVGSADLEGVTNALLGAIKSGIGGAEDYTSAMATMNAIIGAGNMRMDDLVGAFTTGILPAARGAGLGLRDVGAAVAIFTQAGQPAQITATRLRMAFAMMQAPTAKARAALKELGLGSEDLATAMRTGGLPAAIELLSGRIETFKQRFGGVRGEVKAAQLILSAFGGGKSGASMLTLIQRSGALRQAWEDIGDNADRYGDIVAKEKEEPINRLRTAWSSVRAALIKLGVVVVPVLTDMADAVSRAVDRFDRLSPSVKKAVVVGVLLVAVLGPILSMVGLIALGIGGLVTAVASVAGAFAMLAGVGAPVLLLGAAVAVLVAAMVAAVVAPKKLQALLERLGLSAGQAAAVVKGLAMTFHVVAAVIKGALNAVLIVARGVLKQIGGYLDVLIGVLTLDFKQAWEGIVTIVTNPLNVVVSLVKNFVGTVKSVLQTMWDGIKRKALEAALAIVEPFTHLPKRFGQWAREAKEVFLDELSEMATARANEAAEALAENFGHIVIPRFRVIGTQAGQSFGIGFNGALPGILDFPVPADVGPRAWWAARKGKWVDEAGKVIADQQAAWDALLRKRGGGAPKPRPGEMVTLTPSPPLVPTPTLTPELEPDKKKKKKGKGEGGVSDLIPARLQLRELEAARTKWLGDDLKVLRAELKFLAEMKARLRKRGDLTVAKRLEIEREIDSIRAKIRDVNERIRDKLQVDLTGIPPAMRIRETRAERTKTIKDDIAAQKEQLAYWRKLLDQLRRKHADLEDIASVEEEITRAILRIRDLREEQNEAAKEARDEMKELAFTLLGEQAGFFGSFGPNIFVQGAPGAGTPTVRVPGSVPPSFHEGGVVGGRGNRDVLALLSPGEGVLNQRQMESLAGSKTARDDSGRGVASVLIRTPLVKIIAGRVLGGTGERESKDGSGAPRDQRMGALSRPGRLSLDTERATSLASSINVRDGREPAGRAPMIAKFENHQHFKVPTTDRHREARYARVAVESVFDGVGA